MLNSYKISEYKQDFRPALPRHSTNTARVHFKGHTSDPSVNKRNSIRPVDSSSPWQKQKSLHSPDDEINSNDSLISKDSPASSPRRHIGSPNRNGRNLNFENLASKNLSVEPTSQFTSIHLNENSVSGYDERLNTSIEEYDDQGKKIKKRPGESKQ